MLFVISVADAQQPTFAPMQLVNGLQLLATHCSVWAATSDREAPLVRDLLSQLTEHVRTVGVHVTHLLQVGWLCRRQTNAFWAFPSNE